jgi:hypothetical protein
MQGMRADKPGKEIEGKGQILPGLRGTHHDQRETMFAVSVKEFGI